MSIEIPPKYTLSEIEAHRGAYGIISGPMICVEKPYEAGPRGVAGFLPASVTR